jgi:hypothetical protein
MTPSKLQNFDFFSKHRLKAPHLEQFIIAKVEEVQAHKDKEHWDLVPKSNVPNDTLILLAVWSLNHKSQINTREVYKWKARLMSMAQNRSKMYTTAGKHTVP